ncbi:TNFAIP3-interacting protein 2 [Amia ocellicauda]|uniref:TNFAIP3-interacting protein 2 n=1 Tax=Amia ocellicauda TaxID=2972642 RepID=UPI003463D684
MDDPRLKGKIQSYTAVNTFYHETCQEVAQLKQQLYHRDNTIADLAARLGRYESTAVSAGAEEPVVFGPSKSLFENLCQEIRKLKQQHKEAQRVAVQQLDASRLEMQTLQQQLREKEQEIQRMMSRPQHEKDLEIMQLRRTVDERDRVQATRVVLCHSLAEEADQLRTQLGTTVGVCQQLMHKLEQRQQFGDSEEAHLRSEPPKECGDASRMAQLEAVICELQEENKSLKHKVAYVESLNAKWQKYDSSREEYVKGLFQKLKQSNPQAGLVPVPTNSSLMQQEIRRLNRLLEEKMKDCSSVSKQLEESRKRDSERIQMLEQQVLIYADDFKSERADRERAQSKIQDLQDEILRLQLQIRRQDSRDQAASCRIRLGNLTVMHVETEAADPLQRSSPDPPGPSRPNSQAPQDLALAVRTERRAMTDLQCPRCLTTYNDDQTAEFLKHCTDCAEL